MRLLFLSNVFPNPYQPTKGTFNLELVRALSREHDVRVLSPLSWVDEWRARRKGLPALPALRGLMVGGVGAFFPRYYYPPKVLRHLYGWFLWRSVRAAARRVVEERRPDAVLG